jgi:O-methyltransferase
MAQSTRDLYLDLLIKILANTIYGDASTNPENAGAYRAELRAVGLDWPAVAHTMVGMRRLQNLRELAQRVLEDEITGDFVEAGVWRGGCCILMRGVLAANSVINRRSMWPTHSLASRSRTQTRSLPTRTGTYAATQNWRSLSPT